MEDIRGVRLRKFKLRKNILGVRMHFRHSYMIYRAVLFSMTLNDLYPRFQGHAILWRYRVSQKRYDIQCHWNTNKDLQTPDAAVSFRMSLSDLAKYSMTRSARGLSATAELLVLGKIRRGSRWPCKLMEGGIKTSVFRQIPRFISKTVYGNSYNGRRIGTYYYYYYY